MSLQEELRQVEEDLERLRAEVAELRVQVGEVGPTDAVERAMLINQADQQENLVGELEARREDLLKRLSEGGERNHAGPRETPQGDGTRMP
ncbi:hypothetical protein OG339_08230 [Streptosporangium sp. NBC_01495]|uniref:hypothetical protein n=1 Tax=Streptosporangium sp. NBC_01495 TaxID=2903899 RepID=UPI002E2EBF8F|nr:hypothetical protein [Streptosporangium sp. NBC_01495]